ncbi:DUF4129 domain-containing protein [Paenibacillus yanchengensis]|uniref:DUF4129 domain-containing protein n=1 Tax=Paenibacillus yanchengensis TaxID=2035833 RepID=A0ABW4YQ46_9BACL
MKNRDQKYWLLLVKGVLEVLLYLPFIISAAVYSLPQASFYVWLLTLPLIFSLTAWLTELWKQSRVIFDWLIALVVGWGHVFVYVLFFQAALVWWQWLITGLVSSYISFRGIKQTKIGWNSSFDTGYMLIGLASYIVLQMLKRGVATEVLPYDSWLMFGGVLSFFTLVILINERQIKNEAVDGGQSAAAIVAKKQNRTLMSLLIGLFTIITILFLFQKEIGATIKAFFRWLFSWIQSSQPSDPEPTNEPDAAMQPPFVLEEQGEPAAWLIILEQIVKVIAIAIAAAIIITLLYIVIKQLAKILYQLWLRFMGKSEIVGADDANYTDEEEQLTMLNKLGRKRRDQKKQSFRRLRQFDKRWSELTDNKEKVRLLYQRWLMGLNKQHQYTAKPHWTVRETGKDVATTHTDEGNKIEESNLLNYYEAARYGEQSPSDEQTERLKQQIVQPNKQ